MGPYLSLIAPIVAVVNSVISVYLSQFKPEELRIRIRILSLSIILGCLASVATIGSQVYVVSKQDEEKQYRISVRNKLSEFIISSNSIMSMLRNQPGDSKEPEIAANEWFESSLKFVETLGKDYRSRFLTSDGLSSTIPGGVPQAHIPYWLGVYYKGLKLQDFASEFSR